MEFMEFITELSTVSTMVLATQLLDLPTTLPPSRCTPMRCPPTPTSTPSLTTTPTPTSTPPSLTMALASVRALIPLLFLTAGSSTSTTTSTITTATLPRSPTRERLSTLLLPPTPLPLLTTLNLCNIDLTYLFMYFNKNTKPFKK